MEITIDSIAIALSGMPSEAFFAADQIVRNRFRHQAMVVKPIIDAAFAAGREAMREEAAMESEKQGRETGGPGTQWMANRIATAIRAIPKTQ